MHGVARQKRGTYEDHRRSLSSFPPVFLPQPYHKASIRPLAATLGFPIVPVNRSHPSRVYSRITKTINQTFAGRPAKTSKRSAWSQGLALQLLCFGWTTDDGYKSARSSLRNDPHESCESARNCTSHLPVETVECAHDESHGLEYQK